MNEGSQENFMAALHSYCIIMSTQGMHNIPVMRALPSLWFQIGIWGNNVSFSGITADLGLGSSKTPSFLQPQECDEHSRLMHRAYAEVKAKIYLNFKFSSLFKLFLELKPQWFLCCCDSPFNEKVLDVPSNIKETEEQFLHAKWQTIM